MLSLSRRSLYLQCDWQALRIAGESVSQSVGKGNWMFSMLAVVPWVNNPAVNVAAFFFALSLMIYLALRFVKELFRYVKDRLK